jgi:hypothetical protein
MKNRDIEALRLLIESHDAPVVFENLTVADIPSLIEAMNRWAELRGANSDELDAIGSDTRMNDDFAKFIENGGDRS